MWVSADITNVLPAARVPLFSERTGGQQHDRPIETVPPISPVHRATESNQLGHHLDHEDDRNHGCCGGGGRGLAGSWGGGGKSGACGFWRPESCHEGWPITPSELP